MQKSTSPRRKRFRLYAVASAALLSLGSASALIAGVTPATAANLASQPDTQVAVFMVPLTILLIAILFEAARIAWRSALPAEAPLRRTTRRHWSPGQGEG